MLYNILSLFLFYCVLLLLREVYGIDNKRSIKNSTLEKEILIKSENTNKNKKKIKKKLSNESFILLKKKNNTEVDSSGLQLLSYKKPAIQISTVYYRNINATADLAVDGNKNSTFMGGSCSRSQRFEIFPWWIVDLENFFVIDRVEITKRTDCCANIVEFLNVGVVNATFTSAKLVPIDNICGDEIEDAGKLLTVKCNNKVGRYVGVWLNTFAFSLTFCEVEVFGRDLCTAGMYHCDPSKSRCKFNEKIVGKGYTCECLEGLTNNPNNNEECIDINECETPNNICYKNNTMCINLLKSYTCEKPIIPPNNNRQTMILKARLLM